MSALGIDKKNKLELTVNDVADSPAGQVALQATAPHHSLGLCVGLAAASPGQHGRDGAAFAHGRWTDGRSGAGIAALGDLKARRSRFSAARRTRASSSLAPTTTS